MSGHVAGATGDRGRPNRPIRRSLATWLVVAVLIIAPATYLVVSAAQSRDSGEDKQRAAAATEMTDAWPTRLQRRIYEVPVPARSGDVAFLETNSWHTSSLYVQFTTGPGGLDSFLGRIGTSRRSLQPGADAIDAEQRRRADWNLPQGPDVYGIEVERSGERPDHEVVVDLGNQLRPAVYVVSTVEM